jgi:hypothetical protein
MSEQAVKWRRALRFEHPDLHSGMTQAEHNVLTYLAEKQNPRGECRASLKEIAAEKGLSKRHVTRVLNRLVKIGALSRWEKGKVDHWASEFEFGLGFVLVLPTPHRLVTSCPELVTSCPGAGDILSQSGDPLLIENQKQYQRQNQGSAPRFSQADFDERDRRLLLKARNELAEVMVGAYVVEQHPPPLGAVSQRMIFEKVCSRAGIPFARGCHLENRLDWIEDAPQAKRPPQRAVNE